VRVVRFYVSCPASEDIPDRMPERMNMSIIMPEDMSELMPERMSEYMPERMTSRWCVRNYVRIMCQDGDRSKNVF
jgi:hypothetical protein